MLTASLGVWSSSTSVPGGEVGWYLAVGNDGVRPVTVTSVAGSDGRLRLRMREDAGRRVPVGDEVAIPLSIRLTCPPAATGDDPAAGALTAEVGVRREDGGSTVRRVDLRRGSLVQDVAATLCTVRPGLLDHELSGPVLRAGA